MLAFLDDLLVGKQSLPIFILKYWQAYRPRVCIPCAAASRPDYLFL